MTRLTHRAYIVEKAPEGSNRKDRWTEIGAVWPHKQGGGFDLIIPAGISVSGRIVCTVPRDEPVAP